MHKQNPAVAAWAVMLLVGVAAVLLPAGAAAAADVIKANNTTALDQAGSWTSGTAPTSADVAVWNSTVTAANTVLYGTDLSWQGVRIANPGGLVTLGNTGSTQTLTIGSAGVDLSSATQNLLINGNISVSGSQAWSVANGRTLQLFTINTARTMVGSGTMYLTNATGSGTATFDLRPGSSGSILFTAQAGVSGYTGSWYIGPNTIVKTLRNGINAWGSGTLYLAGGVVGQQQQFSGAWTNTMELVANTTSTFDDFNTNGTRYLQLNGVIQGTGNVTFRDTNAGVTSTKDSTFTLAAANTMSGTVTVAAASFLRVGGVGGNTNSATANVPTAGTQGTLGTARVALAATSGLAFTRTDALTVSNTISGAGVVYVGSADANLAATATQDLTLSASNSFSGGTELLAGTLRINALSGIGSGYLAVKNGGTFVYAGSGTESTTRNLFLDSGAATINVSNAAGSLSWTDASAKNQAFTKAGAGTLTLAGVFSGSASVNASAGTLRLTSATSSYTGVTSVSGGTLEVTKLANGGSVSSIGAATNAAANLVFSGGTLTYTGVGDSTDRAFTIGAAARINANGSGGLVWSAATPAFTAPNTAYEFTLGGTGAAASTFGTPLANNGSGAVSLRKADTGTWVLTGSHGYTGATAVDAGTLVVNGAAAASAFTVGSGAILGGSGTTGGVTLAAGGAVSPGNSPGNLTVGNMTWDPASSYRWEMYDYLGGQGVGWDLVTGTGGLTVNATSGSPFTINLVSLSGSSTPGTLPPERWSQTTSGSFRIATFAGGITAPSGTWWSVNTSGFTPYSASLGTFSLDVQPNDIYLVYNHTPPQSYDWTAGTGVWSDGANWSTNPDTPEGTPEIFFSGAGGTSTNDIVSGTGANQLAVVAGLTFSGSAGGYTLTGNALNLGAIGVVNASSVQQNVQNGIALTTTSIMDATSGPLVLSGTVDTAGYSLTVTGSNATTVSAPVVGSGGVTKLGTAALTLSASNAFSGGLTLTAGTLRVGDDAALGSGTATLNGGKLSADGVTSRTLVNPVALGGDVTLGDGTNTGGLTLAGGVSLGGASRVVTVDSSVVVSGTISSGGLTKHGSGSLALTAANTFAGGFTLASGTVLVGNNAALGTGQATLNGGVLSANGTTGRSLSNGLVIGGPVTLGDATNTGVLTFSGTVSLGAATREITAASEVTVSGVISNGGLTKAGPATLTLTAANSFTGPATVGSGTLKFSGSGDVGSSSGVSIASGATLDWARAANMTRAISGSGTILRSTSGNASFSGANSAFAGSWLITAGYVGLASDSVVGSSAVGMTWSGGLGAGIYFGTTGNTLAATRTITLSGAGGTLNGATSNTNTFAAMFTGTGNLYKVSGERAILTNVNDFTGAIDITGGGTLEIGGSGKLGGSAGVYGGAITMGAGNQIDFSTSSNQTLGGVVGGAGFLTKSGAGTLTLIASNTYTGNTAINGGTLKVSGTGAYLYNGGFTNTSTITIGTGGVLELDSFGYGRPGGTGQLSNYGARRVLNGGTINVVGPSHTSANDFSVANGGSGSFAMAQAGQMLTLLGNTNSNIAIGGTLTFGGAGSITVHEVIENNTGAGSIIKAGAGTLVLAGTSTYTGSTTVAGGMLLVNGQLANTSGLSLASSGTVGGSGVVAAMLSGVGLVSPGSSPGILTANAVDPTGGMAFAFEFTGTGSPTYGSSTASVNDVLRLTAGSPFAASLAGANVVDVYLNQATVAAGDIFRGGFYTDIGGDFLPLIENATYQYWVSGTGGGTDRTFNGQGYFSLANYDPALSVTKSTVAESANFGGGSVNGSVTQFVVVPEPGSMAAVGIIAGLACWAGRRRRFLVAGRR